MKLHKLLRVFSFVFVVCALAAPGLYTSTVEGNASQLPQVRQTPTAPANSRVDPQAAAERHVRENLGTLGLVEGDIAEWVVSDRYTTKHNGVTHVYYQQRLDGIEVFGGVLNVNVTRAGGVASVGNRFARTRQRRQRARAPPHPRPVRRAAGPAAHKLPSVRTPPLVQKLVGGRPNSVFAAACSSRACPSRRAPIPARPRRRAPRVGRAAPAGQQSLLARQS